jgi:hypothetical protein
VRVRGGMEVPSRTLKPMPLAQSMVLVGGGGKVMMREGVGGRGEDCGVAREDGVAFTYGYLYSWSTLRISKGVFSAVEPGGYGRKKMWE